MLIFLLIKEQTILDIHQLGKDQDQRTFYFVASNVYKQSPENLTQIIAKKGPIADTIFVIYEVKYRSCRSNALHIGNLFNRTTTTPFTFKQRPLSPISVINQIHNNREMNYEYFQSLSYPSQDTDAYSSDQGSVRGRLDSGSFSNSSSENLEGHKKRRSHRPRGCRGGGSRRQRMALREQAAREREMMQALQENVEPGGNSHQSELNASSSEYYYPPKFVSDNSYMPDTQGGVFKENPRNSESVAPMIQSSMSSLSNTSSISWPANNEHHFSISRNELSSNRYTDSQGNVCTRVPYGQMSASESRANNSNVPNRNQLRYEQQASSNIIHPSQVLRMDSKANNNKGAASVLPPLLMETQENEPKEMQGPNPYALKSSRFQSDLTEALEADGADYRVGRIEKQCQMLAGGGSLFVTSPCSFLMGRKKKQSF
jgi:hypothetical protein